MSLRFPTGAPVSSGSRLTSRTVNRFPDPAEQTERAAGIEVGRAYGEVEGYRPRPFGCEVGSHFHWRHVSRSPPIMRYKRISQGTV